jgi:hypothetical protein
MSPSESAVPAPFILLRHEPSDASPLGMASGVVELVAGCLYVRDGLLIWPPEYKFGARGLSPAVVGDGVAIVPGDTVTIGGGEYTNLQFMPSRLIGDAPPCAADSYIWVSKTTSVEPGSLFP